MSIVGPRPHPIFLNDKYRDQIQKFSKRHASKPGVTGLAQAMGYRGEIQEYHQMNSKSETRPFLSSELEFLTRSKDCITDYLFYSEGVKKMLIDLYSQRGK